MEKNPNPASVALRHNSVVKRTIEREVMALGANQSVQFDIEKMGISLNTLRSYVYAIRKSYGINVATKRVTRDAYQVTRFEELPGWNDK